MHEPEAAPPWWHAALPALLVANIAMFQLAYRGGFHFTAPTFWQMAVTLAACAALLVRYRQPVAVTWVTIVLGTALPVFAPHTVIIDTPSIVALYTLTRLTDRRTSWTAGAGAIILLTASSVIWPPDSFNVRIVLPANYVIIAVALGESARNRRALLWEAQHRAREAERIRIAQDLHDVVAHHITLVNAQAGVAHHLLDQHPDQARRALADIKQTSRAALDELRATVGLLRHNDDSPQSREPAPGLDQLGRLADSFRAAGYTVNLTRHGVPQLTGTVDLAAYRIVQEALTNASKHGVERRVDIALTCSGDALEIVAVNPASPGHRGAGTGHGLIGMRERAESAGGRCTAGMRPDGWYEVRASLPLRG
ncbi:sensor histidine kinase [Lentzea kentuckyensis]|uniref:sensor histidine kinase n=1 Tax=Lentzea kentuckyensis TaxID=360086 RepID=UPI000A36CB07|nr:histidine kinase [Lentzea kentuckyensis]